MVRPDVSLTQAEQAVVAGEQRHSSAGFAPVLGANRDRSVTAESARGLLVTVMGEFVLPEGGTAWTQTLIAAMELLGVRPKTTRQALSRMEKQDWLERERDGRRTRWTITEPFRQLLNDGATRIYGFGLVQREWNERWLVLNVSVPERDRKLRYRLAQGLNWAGFGSTGHGLWINPWVDQEAVAVELLKRLGVEAVLFRSELGELGSGQDLVEKAWDLPSLQQRYADFLRFVDGVDLHDVIGGTAGAALGGEYAAGRLAEVVHEWRRFPFLDPDLPGPLLPPDWPGPTAAHRFADVRSKLSPAARRWWSTVDGR